MDLISIVIPIYNTGKYLRRAINSVLKQTYKNIEIILIDDGSIDESGKICDEYDQKYDNIKVLHKQNQGLGPARNDGIKLSRGKYLTFIDSDDSILETHIENMYNLIIETGSDTCLAGCTRVLKEKEIICKNVCAGQVYKDKEIKNNILTRMCGKKYNGSDYIEMSVCMALFSKNIIDKYKLKFVSERQLISEDLIFDFSYYVNSKKVCVSEDIGYYYYDNSNSLTTKYNSERFNLQKKMTNELIKLTKQNGIYDKSRERINNTFISIARYCIKLEVKFSPKEYIMNVKKDNSYKQCKNCGRIIKIVKNLKKLLTNAS